MGSGGRPGAVPGEETHFWGHTGNRLGGQEAGEDAGPMVQEGVRPELPLRTQDRDRQEAPRLRGGGMGLAADRL